MQGSPLAGRTLGDFEIVEHVATGGFGEVFRARQRTLGRDVIVKVSSAATEQHARERFTREAQLASQLDHPYAAHIYAFGVETDGLQWIAMELVRGISLAELLKAQGPLPVSRFVPLFRAICQVVQVAHEQGIVHRDLKPANVMVVGRAGVLLPKLLDLGIARLYATDLADPADARIDRVLEGEIGKPPTTDHAPRATSRSASASTPDDLERFDAELGELLGSRLAQIAATPDQLDLTSGALYLGSPPYMAPEQWLRPQAAGPACDIYALGILAYECLTGQHPYRGATLKELALAHLQPLPAVRLALPSLDAVLAKAVAKRARDRFPDALALSSAFEAACRIEAFTPLPRAPADLVASVLARAPQPLAEAVAAADVATRDTDAIARYIVALKLVGHYVGILGFASWCRLGNPDPEGEVRELVRALTRGGLDGNAWLDLTVAVTRSFARIRDAFPVPELVDLCHRKGDAGTAVDRLRSRLAAASDDAPQLATLVEATTDALIAIGELFEYDLCVGTARGCERWAGIRRQPRQLVGARIDLAAGAPVLVDRNGAPVLSLWPIAKAIAPTAAADPELFLLTARGRYGARLVAQPHGFERQDPELATWLEELAGETEVNADAEREGREPYRGLASFAAGDNEFFFGRERESEQLANHLRTRAFAAVVGPSGAGKSSFVQAGVVPLLPASWRTVVMRPGSAPMTALHERLAPLGLEPLPAHQHHDATAVLAWLEREARRRGERIVIYVDQCEELVTLTRDEVERVAFAQLLASVRDEELVRVVVTLRDDFLMRLQRLPGLAERLPPNIHLLGTPSRADLRRILIEPSRRMGYEIEDRELVEEMVGAVTDSPSALALLSFTASRLWELRDRQFKVLRRRVYTSLGGVGGALAQHAEEVIVTMSGAERELVREAFRHLVTSDGTRAVIGKAELAQLLGGGSQATRVIDGLVDARLAVTTDSSSGVTIEVTHEALLESWPRLVTWRRDDAENARMREQLRASARQWEARGRPRGLLWRGDVLVEYRVWRARYRGRLGEIEEAFSAACLREQRNGVLRQRVILAAAFAALVATAIVLYVFATRARRSAAQATRNTIALLEEQGQRELLDHHPLRAARSLSRAYALGGDHPSLRFLLGMAMPSVEGRGATLAGHTGFVRRAVFASDGNRVVTVSDDQTLRLWDVATGAELRSVALRGAPKLARTRDHELVAIASGNEVTVRRTRDLEVATRWELPPETIASSIAVSDDARRVVVGDAAGHVHVLTDEARNANDAAPRRITLALHKGAVPAAAISGDGNVWATGAADGRVSLGRRDRTEPTRTTDDSVVALVHGEQGVSVLAIDRAAGKLVSGGRDGIAKLWAVDTALLVRSLPGHAKTIRAVAFSPDGSRIASASEDATIRLWSVGRDQPAVVLTGHEGAVFSSVFDRSGRQLVTAGADGTVRVWDVTSESSLTVFDAHVAEAWFADFDTSGQRVASAGFDQTARSWHVPQRDRRFPATYAGGVAAVDFDARGTRLAVAGNDGTAHVLASDGTWLASQPIGHDALKAVALSPDGRRVAIGSESGTAVLWTLDQPGRPVVLEASNKGVFAAVFRPDGTQLAMAGGDGLVRVFEARSGELIRRLPGHREPVWGASYSHDGSLLATASDDRTVRIWDSESGLLVRVLGPLSDQINTVSFDPTAERVACGGADGMLRMFSVADGTLLAKVAAHHENLTRTAFSRDGERVVTASFDRTVAVWDARSLRELARLRRHSAGVLAVAFQPNTDRLLSTGLDGTLWLTTLELELRSPDEIARIVGEPP